MVYKRDHISLGLALLLIALSAFMTNRAYAQTLTFTTLHYPPYIIQEKDGVVKGFDVEVTLEAFRRLGITVKIEIYPWKRAVFIAESGGSDGLLTCSPRKEFIMSDPISRGTDTLFLRGDHNLTERPISSVSDLKSYPDLKVGGVSGYKQLQLLRDADINFTESRDDMSGIRQLLGGRIDVLLSIGEYGAYLLKQMKPSEILHMVPLRGKNYHLCLSKDLNNHTKIRDDFNRMLKEMKQDGTFDAIHNKYR